MSDRQRGMTLIELLVALAIMSLLLTLVYSSLHNGNTLVNRVVHHADKTEQYHSALRLIRRQIEHSVLLEQEDNRARRVQRFRGLSQSLTLIAPLPLYSDSDLLYEMRFYQQGAALIMSFYRADASQDEVEHLTLLDNLEHFSIEYQSVDRQWLSHWLHKRELPTVVRINLRRATAKSAESFYFPLRLSWGIRA